MKRSLIILSILLPAFSWAQPKEDLSERVLELCQYIPDHGLKPEAKDYLTPEFFRVLSEAFDAPVVDYGGIGDNEWLWYFVTGRWWRNIQRWDGRSKRTTIPNPFTGGNYNV